MSPHWLNQYAGQCFKWQAAKHDDRISYYRDLGLVERCFDVDGRHFEGRADISIRLDFTLQTSLSKAEFQRHIVLAWSCLRLQHVFASAKAPAWQPWMIKPSSSAYTYCFQIDVPSSVDAAIHEASAQTVFVDNGDPSEFYMQCQNSARVLDVDSALAKLFVIPTGDAVSCVFVAAHQIGDGLSTGRWVLDFSRLLNLTNDALLGELADAIKAENIERSLPPAQETLYPPVKGSRARRRWFWLLTRILRHVRKPLPAGFPNPLLRRESLHQPVQKRYQGALDYSRVPPILSAPCSARTSIKASQRMAKICKQAGVSVGAGCFALAALLMMEFYERQYPDVPLHERKPFITGFPLNPRPFLVGNPEANSLMLAFSDGILLPFLPSDLDLEGRLRLLAKTAQRQLAVYQKRTAIVPDEKGLQYMSSRGAGRVLAIQYLGSFERCEMLLPEGQRQGSNPQGAYPMRPNETRQTCGVSSVGKTQPLNVLVKYSNPDFKTTATNMQANVRARDGEFLVGVSGNDKGIGTSISVDDTSMDPGLVQQWLHRFEHILEEQDSAKL